MHLTIAFLVVLCIHECPNAIESHFVETVASQIDTLQRPMRP